MSAIGGLWHANSCHCGSSGVCLPTCRNVCCICIPWVLVSFLQQLLWLARWLGEDVLSSQQQSTAIMMYWAVGSLPGRCRCIAKSSSSQASASRAIQDQPRGGRPFVVSKEQLM